MKLDFEAITNQNAMQVAEAGRTAILAGDRVIDFAGVLRCDTAALACILAWIRLARSRRCELELVALPKNLRSLAKLYGVQALIDGV